MLRQIQRQRKLNNKVVLVRVDMNVPLKRKHILDDSRIVASLPTIEFLQKKKAKIILVTHIGRPDGKVVPALSVGPVIDRLSELLGTPVKKLDTKGWPSSGSAATKMRMKLLYDIEHMNGGEIAMMENIRFAQDEKKNSGQLAGELANLADMFVLDCFAVAHRNHASVVGPAELIPSFAGVLFQKEVQTLNSLIQTPKYPFVAVIGGAKLETKIPVIKNLSTFADQILIGGTIVPTYFWAKGYGVGSSKKDIGFKKEILQYGKKRNIVMPMDVIVGKLDGSSYRVVDIQKTSHQICKRGELILDIGPKTIKQYAPIIKRAQSLVWNGAMGYFEQSPYHIGTHAIARLVGTVASGKAFGVIGGGETILATEQVEMIDHMDHVSTGGGAMLEYLAGNELPGLSVLENSCIL